MNSLKSKLVSIFLHILYYFILFILIFALIYPYTSFRFDKPFFIPFNKKLNHTDVVLEKGETIRIYPVAPHKWVKYSSTDFKAAEVNNTGLVSAKRVGMAIINVKTPSGSTKCRIRIVALNHTSIQISKGESVSLKLYGNGGTVKWHSSKTKTVSVSKNGIITGKAAGKATITASWKKKKLKCTVTVKFQS